MFKLLEILFSLNYFIIDTFFIKILIHILLIALFTYTALLASLTFLIDIGENMKVSYKLFRVHLKNLSQFHFNFIIILYTLTYLLNFVMLIGYMHLSYSKLLLFVINYLIINVIFHAYCTGISNSRNFMGTYNKECLFFGNISCLLIRYLVMLNLLDE